MMLNVQLVYATPSQQVMQLLTVPAGTTIQAAILQSNLLHIFPEIDPAHSAVGIFGKKVPLSQMLCDQDRIEIYRPLAIDPKQARRVRGKKVKREQS
jgi:putative ubiquitin-RnfH superfamily antitoxin RatB of RatAB toxin-antitoxin module